MKTYTGTVKFSVGEPYDAGFGPRINLAVAVDDAAAPKAKDGIVKIYKPVDATGEEADYMRSLGVGEPVELVYQSNAKGGWYNLLIPKVWSSTASNDVGNEAVGSGGEVGGKAVSFPADSIQFYIPLNGEQVAVFNAITTEKVQLLLHTMAIAEAQAKEHGIELDAETNWKLAVTAYINASKEFRRGYILPDDEPAF